VPEPDELGYDPELHSPEALKRAYEAVAGKKPEALIKAAAAADAAAVAAAAAAGGDGDEEGRGIEDGIELDEGVYDMPDVPAVDMM
jgi:hypothetical protein